MIKLWINQVLREEFDSYMYDGRNSSPKTVWTFMGDGSGDYEEMNHHATREVVENYIKDCLTQIEWAQEYLEETCHDESDHD